MFSLVPLPFWPYTVIFNSSILPYFVKKGHNAGHNAG